MCNKKNLKREVTRTRLESQQEAIRTSTQLNRTWKQKNENEKDGREGKRTRDRKTDSEKEAERNKKKEAKKKENANYCFLYIERERKREIQAIVAPHTCICIGVPHTACKDEFGQNLRSHSWSVILFL